MGGETQAAWRHVLEDLLARGLKAPELLIVDGGIERLHGEFKRRVKTQCALPNAETAAMLFWALMASGQITMRRVGGWQTLDQAPVKQPIDLAA